MNNKISVSRQLATKVHYCVHDDNFCEVRKTHQPYFYGATDLELELSVRFCAMDWLNMKERSLPGSGAFFLSVFDPVETDICIGHFKLTYVIAQDPLVMGVFRSINSCIRLE